MTNVIKFIPRRDLSASQNLQGFIETARDILPTWSNLDGFTWENSRWLTTYRGVRFTNEESSALHRSVTPTPEQLMHPKFMLAAKAYLRFRHHLEPHRNIGREMAALRALEYVLRKDMGVPDITKVSGRHFDDAVELISRHKSAAFVARELLTILQRLAEYEIVTNNCNFWTHRYVGALSYSKTNGALAPQGVKDKKLPDQDALLAIADVFSRGYQVPLEHVDVMITSITAVLLCAPTRIGELNRFRVDCIATDEDRDGKTQHYLKYWVPKTKEFARKPMPATMAEIGVEAIRRLAQITEEGRRLAEYMETNPTHFYRHSNCPDVADDKVLTREQVAQALGLASTGSAEMYMSRFTGSSRLTGYTLDSLWKIVLQDHENANPNFPYQESPEGQEVVPLKMSESLLCCLRYQFSPGHLNRSPVLLAPFNGSYYTSRLEGRKRKNLKNPLPICFYTRHGFEPKKLKSHSPRHLLNRLAKQSGLSIDTITAWSNRSTSWQTLTYLDSDQGQAANSAAVLMEMDSEQQPKAPIASEEDIIYEKGPVHRSRYGLCRRSWRIGPCNKFADCLNCSELLMCKGDRFGYAAVQADRDRMLQTYNLAQEAIERGERSATRWVKISGVQIKKLNELLSVLEDPSIPDGSPIGISGTDFSHEQTVVAQKMQEAGIELLDRTKLAIEYGADLLACLDELREI